MRSEALERRAERLFVHHGEKLPDGLQRARQPHPSPGLPCQRKQSVQCLECPVIVENWGDESRWSGCGCERDVRLKPRVPCFSSVTAT